MARRLGLLFLRPISVRIARGRIPELWLGRSAEGIQAGRCGGRDVRGGWKSCNRSSHRHSDNVSYISHFSSDMNKISCSKTTVVSLLSLYTCRAQWYFPSGNRSSVGKDQLITCNRVPVGLTHDNPTWQKSFVGDLRAFMTEVCVERGCDARGQGTMITWAPLPPLRGLL